MKDVHLLSVEIDNDAFNAEARAEKEDAKRWAAFKRKMKRREQRGRAHEALLKRHAKAKS